MADHTPTPWKIHSGRAQGAYGPVEAEIRGANFVTVRLGRYSDQVKADAALICRAVNTHEELTRCLGWALTFAQGSHDGDADLRNPKFSEWLERCHAALAKAQVGRVTS